MKHLVVGPAAMGIYAFMGALKKLESQLDEVEEYSGSSAGAILCTMLACGLSVDDIIDKCLNLDTGEFVRVSIPMFLSNYGFVDTEPIREKFVELLGSDPTFEEVKKPLYVAAYCLNTSSTVHFSKFTHPKMRVSDAVVMSLSIPFIFATKNYEGYTYCDGSTAVILPDSPFMGKPPSKITYIRVTCDKRFMPKIKNHTQFIEAIVRSTFNMREDKTIAGSKTHTIDLGSMNLFDFHMDFEQKVVLFNMGYDSVR
jgi:NTE family protein